MNREIEPPRLLVLVGEINVGMVEKTAGVLTELNALSHKPIEVHLTSGGGSLDCGMAIHDLLALSASPVTVRVFGCCDSSAVLVLQGAATRLIAPNATMMLHKGSLAIDARLEEADLARFRTMSFRNDDRYAAVIAERSGLSKAKVSAMCKKVTTLEAPEVLRLGLADGIIGAPAGRRPRPKQKTA